MLDDGVDMVVAEARIRYLASLGFDDEADLVVRAVKLGNTSMTSELAIERGGEAVAEGELRHVFVEPRQPRRDPDPGADPRRARALLGLSAPLLVGDHDVLLEHQLVLGPPRGPLHRDQVIDRGDATPRRPPAGGVRLAAKLVVRPDSGHMAEDVEVARTSCRT